MLAACCARALHRMRAPVSNLSPGVWAQETCTFCGHNNFWGISNGQIHLNPGRMPRQCSAHREKVANEIRYSYLIVDLKLAKMP